VRVLVVVPQKSHCIPTAGRIGNPAIVPRRE
jgi:hypothetical protein